MPVLLTGDAKREYTRLAVERLRKRRREAAGLGPARLGLALVKSKKRRSEIATQGANARWAKAKEKRAA